MFVANLPSWNRLISVYRVVDTVAGNTLRGVISGQAYAANKRTTADDGSGLTTLLYPYNTALTLHTPLTLPFIGGQAQLDIAVFPWVRSPFEDGLFYGFVSNMTPRYDTFPNAHNAAFLNLLSLANKLLWFPDPPPPPLASFSIDWAGLEDDECPACAALPLTFSLDVDSPGGGQGPEFAWDCASGGFARWDVFNDPTLPLVFANLVDVGLNATLYGYQSATAWDETSPIVLDLVVTAGDPLCVAPLAISLQRDP